MNVSESDIELSDLPKYVRERWPAAVERAKRKTSTAKPNNDTANLVKAAQKASTATQRVVWLHRAASAWTKPLAAVAACGRGCSHCCHIPVTISSVEAALIGRHTERTPARPALAVRVDSFSDLESALPAVQAIGLRAGHSRCPFLVDDACSIYEVRPMACRLLINLDDDDLLCRLVPGQDIPVPYADSSPLKAMYLLAQPATPLADIREFFPQRSTDAPQDGEWLPATSGSP